IASCPHAVDRRLRQCPSDYCRHCFTHQTLAPPPPSQRVAQIDRAGAYSDLDQACESAILLPPETPRKCRPLNPPPLAASQEFDRLIDTAMRLPRHVLGDRCIACVLIEDHLRILDHSRLGGKPRRLPRTLRSCHGVESGRANAVLLPPRRRSAASEGTGQRASGARRRLQHLLG